MITTLYNRVHRPTADEPAVFTVLLEAVKGELATHYILTEKFSTHREDIYDFAYQPPCFSRAILETWGYERVVLRGTENKKEYACYIPEGVWEELSTQMAPNRVPYEHLLQTSPHITDDTVEEIEESLLDEMETIYLRSILKGARRNEDAIDEAVRVSHQFFEGAEKVGTMLAEALRYALESTQPKGA